MSNVSNWAQQMLATYFPSTPSTPSTPTSAPQTPSVAGVNYTPMTFTTNSAGQTAAVPKQTYTPMTITTNAAGQIAAVPVSSGSSAPAPTYTSNPATMQSVVTPASSGGSSAPAPVAQTSSGGGSSPAPVSPVSGGGSSQLPELQAQLTDLQSKLAEAQKLGLAPTDTIPDAIMKGMTAEAYMTSDEYRKVQEQKDKVEAERKAAELKDLEYNNQIAILKKQIADVQAGVGQPKAPELLETHKDLMAEHSMPTLAQDINDLKALQREMEASAREGVRKQEGRLAPMGLISTRQQELASRANEEMDFINRQIQTKVDEYNTKLSMIGMTMDLVKADYETSYKVYSDNWTRTMQLQTSLFDAIDKEKDSVRADASVLMDMISKSGMSITPEMSSMLSKFEMQLGYPSGILSAYTSNLAKTGGKIVAQEKRVGNDGKEFIQIIKQNPDGSYVTENVGLAGTSGTGTGTGTDVFTTSNLQAAVDLVRKDNAMDPIKLTGLFKEKGIKIDPKDAALLIDSANNQILSQVPQIVQGIPEDKAKEIVDSLKSVISKELDMPYLQLGGFNLRAEYSNYKDILFSAYSKSQETTVNAKGETVYKYPEANDKVWSMISPYVYK